MIRISFLIFIFCFAPVFAEESRVEIEVIVKGAGGRTVPNATVSIEGTDVVMETDEKGRCDLEVLPGAHTIIVQATGFEIYGERFSTGNRTRFQMTILLLPHSLQFEEIVVAPNESVSGASVSSPVVSVNPGEKTNSNSVLSSVTDVAGVAPVGQGGLFQVPSIRGAARERTILLVDSVRVTSERRTGASLSFVDPLMTQRLLVLRGPAPVLYGSNGETGLIQSQLLEPISADPQIEFRTGYESNSNQNWQSLTFQNGSEGFQYALGVVHRSQADYQAGDNTKYPSRFNRTNVLAKGRWLTQSGILTVTVMPSWTDDIDKASNDSLTRPTVYPEERHQIYQLDWQNAILEGAYDFQVQGWYHPNSLITQDERVNDGVTTSRAVVFNDTDDYGARFRIGRKGFGTWRFWTGFDLFGRANVNSREEDYALSESGSGLEPAGGFTSIQNGSYLDTGLFITGSGNIGRMQTTGGVRLQRVSVGNDAGTSISSSEYSWSGNISGRVPLSSDWDAVFSLGRGIRPATISEKFFTGATGRGSVIGNPDLVTESNFEIDGGIRFTKKNSYAAFYLFRNNIHDFVSRVRIEDDAFTFVNLPKVAIYGFEGEAIYSWNHFRFFGNFHSIQGHDSTGMDVNDIPPSRLVAGVEYEPTTKEWMVSFEMTRQFSKKDPGPDELSRGAALILNASGQWNVLPELSFRFGVLNLTNRTYYNSADNRAPLAMGRSATIEMVVRFP